MQLNIIYESALRSLFRAMTGTVALLIYFFLFFALVVVILVDLMVHKIRSLESLEERYENDI